MKYCLLAVGLIGVMLVAAVRAGDAPPVLTCGDRGLLMKITVPEGPQKAGEAIPMKLSITNTTAADVQLPNNLTYAVDADPGLNKPMVGAGVFIVCQTESGDFLKYKGGYVKASGSGTPVKAGQELKAYTLDLAKCFDLPAGRYEVQLLFTTKHSGFLDGASNRISITIK
jgi:hypothetical protein